MSAVAIPAPQVTSRPATTPEGVTTEPGKPLRPVPVCWAHQLGTAEPVAPTCWLWEGYLALGQITLCTSRWKIGKSTLLSVLLAKLYGGGTLAGQTVHPARAIVLTEENAAQWQERKDRLGLDRQVGLVFNPYLGKPSQRQWLRLLKRLVALHAEQPYQLLVIDPLATFLPGADENSAGGMMKKLQPLKQITRLGVAVLLLHHPGKREAQEGSLARGSGALSAFVDLLVEMRWLDGPNAADRRRKLTAVSRSSLTPANVVIELNEKGTDYEVLGTETDAAFAANWGKLEAVFLRAERKLTRREVAERYDEDEEETKVHLVTIWRWLDRAEREGKIRREGEGNPRSPYLYWLEMMEPIWEAAAEKARQEERDEYLRFKARQAAELLAAKEQIKAMGLG